MSSVELRELTKEYGSARAVDGVSLDIEHGSLVCLLGPSGCGKSTTLRLIAGFIEPTAGEIRVGGRVLSAPGRALPPEQRGMSMVFQSYALWPHMTVAENVAYGLRLRGLAREVVGQKLDAILKTMRLDALAERYPGELSGGQQQRVALARALVIEPETLLLDEPLSNLDANLREEMRFEVRRLHDTYRYTTIYVTHDQSEAMTAADLIVIMNAGRIEQTGTPEEIYQRPRTEFVARFIGGSNILRGPVVDGGRVMIAGVALRCDRADVAHGGPASVSVRPHDVGLSADPAAQGGENRLPATIVRQAFLGGSRDYVVEIADGTQLRVSAPAAQSIPSGTAIWLELPYERCRILTG